MHEDEIQKWNIVYLEKNKYPRKKPHLYLGGLSNIQRDESDTFKRKETTPILGPVRWQTAGDPGSCPNISLTFSKDSEESKGD